MLFLIIDPYILIINMVNLKCMVGYANIVFNYETCFLHHHLVNDLLQLANLFIFFVFLEVS